MLEKALMLAASGFAVFPLRPGRKEPLLPGGHKDATREEWIVRGWWSEHPDANIGISPDACEPPMVVIDVEGPDGTHARSGFEELERLRAEGVLPETLTAGTPSGGLHLYYAVQDRGRWRSAVGVRPGIDIRAAGGYVVAPGSRLDDGREWAWIDD